MERQIGELRHKVELFLRNEDVPPRRAVYSMTSAHNNMCRIGGYSPSQWAFGRQVDNADNVAMHSSEGTSDTAMSQNLELRLRAEKKYLELQAKAKISRALNSKTKISSRFLPGDLVYYKRYKVPQDFPAHNLVDQPRLRISRWYGPGRVLATETRVHEQGTRRVAASTVWVVSQGRLKKFHVDQLRHSSERERLIAEQAPLPWTLTAIERLIQKGNFDDYTLEFEKRKNYSQAQRRARSRTPVPVAFPGQSGQASSSASGLHRPEPDPGETADDGMDETQAMEEDATR